MRAGAETLDRTTSSPTHERARKIMALSIGGAGAPCWTLPDFEFRMTESRVAYNRSMVRPDEHTQMMGDCGKGVGSGCIGPAGESPAPVSAEAPGSRPHEERESARSRAGCQKPAHEDRERSDGPQRVVNVEQASSDYQPKGDWERRAGHFTVKATHSVRESEHALGLPGV